MSKIAYRAVLMLGMVLMIVVAMNPLSVKAEGGKRLSTDKKTLSIGQEYTIKLKGLSRREKKKYKKVKWTVSDKSVVCIRGKAQYSITLKARKTGVSKIIAKYRGKKYRCRLTVKARKGNDSRKNNEKEDSDVEGTDKYKNASLNAADVSIYYLDPENRVYIQPISGHLYSFAFQVKGVPKSTTIQWKIESSSKLSSFKLDDGTVYMWAEPGTSGEPEEAVLSAILPNGKKLSAKLHGYSEMYAWIDSKLDGFLAENLRNDMSEYEKVEAIARYVSTKYDYELYQSDWELMVLKGSGDCYSSRYLVKELCERVGIKAIACVGEDIHGITLVKADGKFYEVITGFRDNQPRKYLIYELSDESVEKLAKNSRIDLSYFE